MSINQFRDYVNNKLGPVSASDAIVLKAFLQQRSTADLILKYNNLRYNFNRSKYDQEIFHIIRIILDERNFKSLDNHPLGCIIL